MISKMVGLNLYVQATSMHFARLSSTSRENAFLEITQNIILFCNTKYITLSISLETLQAHKTYYITTKGSYKKLVHSVES